jgi:hypothetical protein
MALGPAIGSAALASFVIGSLLLPDWLNQVAFYVTLLLVFVGLTLLGLRLRSSDLSVPTGQRPRR